MRWTVAASLAAVLALLFAGACATTPAVPDAAPQRLVILHFNDFHGHVLPFKPKGATELMGGAARLATMVAEERAAASRRGVPVLLLVAGDAVQGTALSSVYKGEADFRVLDELDVDAFALGNHEWDFGADILRRRVAEAGFPVLGANVEDRGAPFRPPFVKLRAGGIEVAVLGLTTADTPVTTTIANVADFTFADPVATAKRFSAELDRSGLFVVLSHCGEQVDREIARQVPGVDVIVGGHDHFMFPQPVVENGVPIVQAKEYGEYLGRLELEVRGGRARVVAASLLPVAAGIPLDPAMAALVEPYALALAQRFQEVVGETGVALEGERASVRRAETNLGNWMADALRRAAASDAALVNGGSIRAGIDAGPVTREELISVSPFENYLVVVSMTGAQLAELLERSAALSAKREEGGFLQVSGIRFAIRGGHAAAIEVAGAPLDPARTYTVAMPDFTADGGDGYTLLPQLPRRKLGQLVSDVLIAELSRGPIAPAVDGRIRRE